MLPVIRAISDASKTPWLPRGGQPPDLVRALTPSLFFSFLAVRLNSEAAASSPMTLNWHFPDLQQDYALTVRNGVLTHLADHRHAGPDAEVRMQKADLDRVGLGEISLEKALKDGLIQVSGDGGRVSELFLMLDRFEPGYERQLFRLQASTGDEIDAQVYLHACPPSAPSIPPSDAYLDHLLSGALEHDLPDDYVAKIRSLAEPA